MPAFDAYDYVGYIAPGTILLIALMLLFPRIRELLAGQKFNLSDFGVLIILSFVCGQVLHQLGHVVDDTDFGRIYYTETAFCKDASVLSTDEQARLQSIIKQRYHVDVPCFSDLSEDGKTNWRNIVRQIYVDVHQAKMSERIDIFNRSVGLHLALGTVFAVLFCVCLAIAIGSRVKIEGFKGIRSTLYVASCEDVIKVALLLIALAGASILCFARMQYFAKYYATELFLTYLLQWYPSSSM
jgi:hypothetical protein